MRERIAHDRREAVDAGRQAWRQLSAANPPSIALLDWEMPGLAGPEVVERIRARGEQAPTYVILLTSRDSSADIVTVLKKPDTKDRFEKLGAQPNVDTSPDAFEKYVRREYENFRKLIPEIGLRPQ